MANDLVSYVNNNIQNMAVYQEQLSTGRKINKPSDDPAGVAKSLRLRTSLTEGEQYLSNIADAINYMETMDGSLQNINDVMQRIRELTVKAATGTNSTDEEAAIALEISELNDQLKVIANATYGTKAIFSGTNVTEDPFQDGEWVGNDEQLSIEISAGVTIPMNITDVKNFFNGRMKALNIAEDASGNKILEDLQAQDIQEGHYSVNTCVTTTAVASEANETQSYMSSITKNGSFFYNDASTAASLGAGKTASTSNSDYNASLMLEVKYVQAVYPPGTPRVELSDSTAAAPVLTFDQAMYMNDASDNMAAIADGTDLASDFTYTTASGSTAALTSAVYDDTTHSITFTVDGAPAVGDTVIWNDNVGGDGKSKAYGADGEAYTPVKAVFDGTQWVYDDIPKVTVDIKGHVYSAVDGAYKYVELDNVELNMETANGEALFTIPSSAFNNPDGTANTSFPDDIVVWNNSGNALGGIDPDNPQLSVGDKTVITVTAQQTGLPDETAERVDFGYTFLDVDGEATPESTTSYAFQNEFFDNNTRDLKFFTLNEELGISYSGSISLKTETFTSSDATNPITSFDYEAGIFSFVDDLCAKVEAGKLPQVGNELKGCDSRINTLLLYCSTIGARVNRLELQQSRLESTQTSFTDLLSQNEDVDEAEAIINLKMQENVYQSSLAAGAKIIQPTLIDFLS